MVGMGGAGFPTHVKLSPKEPEKIEYIIANCAECEPYLTADYRRMIETPEDLVAGMKIILQLFDHAKGVFGVENNKPDAIAKLKELIKDEPRMEVCELLTKYPQGGERQLIYAVTGREINSKMLPADAGCIVDNVETMIAIKHAVKRWSACDEANCYNHRRRNYHPVKLFVQYGYTIRAAGGSCRRI